MLLIGPKRGPHMPDPFGGQIPSAQAWCPGVERVGYDRKARGIVPARDLPLKIFLSPEADLAQGVSFLPGFPGGSLGWAKVRPHLLDAAVTDAEVRAIRGQMSRKVSRPCTIQEPISSP